MEANRQRINRAMNELNKNFAYAGSSLEAVSSEENIIRINPEWDPYFSSSNFRYNTSLVTLIKKTLKKNIILKYSLNWNYDDSVCAIIIN